MKLISTSNKKKYELKRKSSVTKPKALRFALISCFCIFWCALSYLGFVLYMYLNQQSIEDRINVMFDTAKQDYVYVDIPTPPPLEIIEEPFDEPEAESEESEWERERRLLLEAEARGRLIYADILAINPDFLGMIEIPGVIARQPYVMSHNNEEYLSRDFNGKRSSSGTVFLNTYNDRLMMDNNSVFFGHYSDTGSMFAKLPNYKQAATFASSPVVILNGLIGESIWIIFAAHVVEPDVWWMTPYNDKDDYAEHLAEIQARSFFTTNVDVTVNDRIITLSVCDYTYEDMRFVVHARRLRPGEDISGGVTATINTNRKDYIIPHPNP